MGKGEVGVLGEGFVVFVFFFRFGNDKNGVDIYD